MTEQERQDDVSYLRKLVLDLNILRRHINSYPTGHPLVEQATLRAYATFSNLLSQRGGLTIGVTRDALILGDDILKAAEPAVRDFAGALFALGIVSLTFSEGLRVDELRRFNECLMMKHLDAASPGSVQKLFDSLGLEHIRIGMVDYGAIQVRAGLLDTLDESPDFWERFVKGVIAGTLNSAGDTAEAERYARSSPEMLADMLSEGISDEKDKTVHALLRLFGRFMQEVDENTVTRDKRSLEKFIQFLHALKPEVRNYFLECAVNALSDRPVVAEVFFDAFSSNLLADILNEGLQKQGSAPPVIMRLLKRLGDLRLQQPSTVERAGVKVLAAAESATVLADESLKQKLQVIFWEEQYEKFVPEEYNAALSALLTSRTLNKSEEQDIQLVKKTLDDHEIEVNMSHILLEMLDAPECADGDSELLGQSILELCGYFIRMGDFAALIAIYERTHRLKHSGEQQQRLMQAFLQADFIEEILRAPVIWGKEKFEEIAALIHLVGEPFIDPILDRLAEENNRSLRQFYVNSLSELGLPAIAKIGARLNDPRWYFVRNLVVILRNTANPAILPYIRTLLNHPNTKVRQNVMKILLQFHDSDALVMLLNDLASNDFEVKMGAIHMAEKHHNQDIIRRLAEIVETGGFSSEEIELKHAAVRTLSGIGDTACIPSFERILRSRSFFHRASRNRLKGEIVSSLSRFPASAVRELLQQVSAFGNYELAQKAKKIAKDMEQYHES